MELIYSARPGPAERHLRRRAGNAVFGPAKSQVAQREIDSARLADELAHAKFIDELGEKLKQAVELPEQVESDVILKLRADLDRLYTVAAGLPGDPERFTTAIAKMIEVLTGAVRGNIGNDALAVAELDEQDEARETHFRLLQDPLIADLLAEESPIAEDELAATLLSEESESAVLAFGLLDTEQRQQLLHQAEALVAEQGNDAYSQRLLVLRGIIEP